MPDEYRYATASERLAIDYPTTDRKGLTRGMGRPDTLDTPPGGFDHATLEPATAQAHSPWDDSILKIDLA